MSDGGATESGGGAAGGAGEASAPDVPEIELISSPSAHLVPPSRIRPPRPTPADVAALAALREELARTAGGGPTAAAFDDAACYRFLRARQNNVPKTVEMVLAHVAWLETMRPGEIRATEMEAEARTGKVRLARSRDRHGRPVLVFDNSKENTWDATANIRHLVFHMERAIAALPPGVDKFVVFIHLSDFAFRTAPPFAVTRATLSTMLDHYPERLGHCIMYRAPWLFASFYSAACVFIDEATQSKIRFVTGDVSDGSENDVALRQLIGDDWKRLTGAEQPVVALGSTPGYNHDEEWGAVAEEDRARVAAK